MRSVVLLLVGLLAGGGLFALGQEVLRGPADPVASEPLLEVDAFDPVTASVLDKVVVRLDRIERQLKDLQIADAPAPRDEPERRGAPGATPPAPAPVKVAIDPDALADAREEVEARKWAEMSPDEVKRAAPRMMKQGNETGSRKARERLLGRKLEPELKADVLTQLGLAQRASRDFEGSEASLREAIRTVGLDSAHGVQAGMQLAWTLAKSEDYGEALRVAEDVIRVPSSEGQLRTNMRWGVGVLSATQGDTARAREEFESVIQAARGNPKLDGLARDAERRLQELR